MLYLKWPIIGLSVSEYENVTGTLIGVTQFSGFIRRLKDQSMEARINVKVNDTISNNFLHLLTMAIPDLSWMINFSI